MTQQQDTAQQLYTVPMLAKELDQTVSYIYGIIKDLDIQCVSEIRTVGTRGRATRVYNEDHLEQMRREIKRRKESIRKMRQGAAARMRKARSLQDQERKINDELIDKYGSEGKGQVICDECDHFWMPYAYTKSENGDTELFMIYCAKCLKQRIFDES